MLEHVTLRALFFRLESIESTLIIWNSGPKCKANFYDRAEVIDTVTKMVRRGVVLCALCGGLFSIHGCYQRHILDENDDRHDGWIVQCCCDNCKKYPSLIPDFIMPYKHYEAAVIEAAVAKVEEEGGIRLADCPAAGSTVWRWVSQFRKRGALAVGWLLAILYTFYGEYLSALELQDKGLLKQLARLARKFPVPGFGGIIGRVNVILTRHNSGFL